MMINYLPSALVEPLGKSFLLPPSSIQVKSTPHAHFKTAHTERKHTFRATTTKVRVRMPAGNYLCYKSESVWIFISNIKTAQNNAPCESVGLGWQGDWVVEKVLRMYVKKKKKKKLKELLHLWYQWFSSNFL